MTDWLALSEGWLFTTSLNPSVVLLLIGGLFGYFIIPEFIDYLRKRGYHRKFTQDFHYTSYAKSGLLSEFGKAYLKWRDQPSIVAPDTYSELIEKADFPSWVPILEMPRWNPIKRLDARAIAKKNVESKEVKGNSDLWEFCIQLFDEVEDCLNQGKTPTLLDVNGCRSFHIYRRSLLSFWQETAENVLKHNRLRFGGLKQELTADESVMKLLTYLDIALWLRNKHSEISNQEMFELFARHFGTYQPKWRRFLAIMRQKA